MLWNGLGWTSEHMVRAHTQARELVAGHMVGISQYSTLSAGIFFGGSNNAW